MKKFLIFALISTLFFASSSADSSAQLKKIQESAKKILAECKTRVGATDEDVRSYKNATIPSSHKGLCLIECVFDTTKVMENGKFCKKGMVDAFHPLVEIKKIPQDGLEKVAEACEKEVGEGDKDRCETAKMVAKCLMKHAEKHNFKLE